MDENFLTRKFPELRYYTIFTFTCTSMITQCMQLLTDTASSGGFPNFIISIVQRLYGSSANQTIVRFNEFSNIAAYLVQKVRVDRGREVEGGWG